MVIIATKIILIENKFQANYYEKNKENFQETIEIIKKLIKDNIILRFSCFLSEAKFGYNSYPTSCKIDLKKKHQITN